jgi:hypothetical protein
MSQQKKNSSVAQASSGLNTEAAIKLLHQVSSISNSSGPHLKDGDGGGEGPCVLNYVIEVAVNGFFVTVCFDDMEVPDLRLIVQTMDEVIEILRGNF